MLKGEIHDIYFGTKSDIAQYWITKHENKVRLG